MLGEPPGFFDRLERLDDVNYAHLLVLKSVGRRMSVSADYTRHTGTSTHRTQPASRPLRMECTAKRF
jgi:hypothetical protein